MTDNGKTFSGSTPAHWRQPSSEGAAPGAMHGTQQWPSSSPLARFLGGSPVAVFLKLLLVSLIVGALMMWLDIRPYDVFRSLTRLIDRLWSLGFDAIREAGTYILAGAMIVVPIWFISRLLTMRGPGK